MVTGCRKRRRADIRVTLQVLLVGDSEERAPKAHRDEKEANSIGTVFPFQESKFDQLHPPTSLRYCASMAYLQNFG